MQSDKGFGFLDLMIIVAIATILMAVAVPSAGSLHDGLVADRVLKTVDDLARAARRHHADTGRFAIELSASADGRSYTHPRHHELSLKQAASGWQGPYLDEPLRQDRSPVGGAVYLVNDLGLAPAHGFALAPDREPITGRGQMVLFHGISRRIAEEIDHRVDGGRRGTGSWNTTGRVEWTPEAGGSLAIFLMSGDETRGEAR